MAASQQKKKKQHYVPQCYLEAWAIPGTHQINVYDKELRKPRVSNILDVASENYFYDINFTKALTEEERQQTGLTEEELKVLSEDQFFENFFADEVEGDLSGLLKKVIANASQLTPWRQFNCYFISEDDKKELSCHLAVQHLRTKSTRNAIMEMSDCLSQMLSDMGASSKTIEDMSVTKDSAKLMHGRMMSDFGELISIAVRMNSFIWMLGVNKTNRTYLTNDRPVGTFPHVRNGFVSMSGIMSEGVEVFYPISPNLILIMFDREYHKQIEHIDRHYFAIEDPDIIDHYNSLCIQQSERCVFSVNDDFSLIHRMLKDSPNAINKPYISATWNGKTYLAEKK